MQQYHLHVWVGHSNTRWAVVDKDLRLLPELQKRVSWPVLLDELRNISDETWSCFFIARYMSKAEAINLGREIAKLIGDVFLELEPLYLITVT